MEVRRRVFNSKDGKEVPSFYINGGGKEAVVIAHGYSSSKSEWLGFGFRVAEKGYDVFVIDLRGHGENVNVLDENVLMDVEGTLESLRQDYDRVVTIGHSLGALLGLCSSSDFVFAISPPLTTKLMPEPAFMLRLNSCTVRETDEGVLLRILQKLNPPERSGNAVIFYGKGESEGIKLSIMNWAKGRDVQVVEIDENQAKMPEVEVSGEKLKNYLPNFVSHLSVKSSTKILESIKF